MAGIADATENITYVYHVHTSDCYEEQNLTCSVLYKSGGITEKHCAGCQKENPDATEIFRKYTFKHSACGAPDHEGMWCTNHQTAPSSYTHTYKATVCICGKTEETIESAIIDFN